MSNTKDKPIIPTVVDTLPTEPYQEAPQLSPPETGHSIDSLASFFLGSASSEIYTFNGNFVYNVGDRNTSDDFYVIGQYQTKNIVLSDSANDSGSNNRLYFDKGVKIISTAYSSGTLDVVFNNNSILTVNNSDGYKFYFGSDTGITAQAVGSLTASETIDEFIEIDLMEEGVETNTQYSAFVIGGSGIDIFTLGFSQNGQLLGAAGDDLYYITRFHESDSMEIVDTTDNNHIIIEAGVTIEGIKESSGTFDIDFGNNKILSVGGAINYKFHREEYEAGTGMTGTAFLAAAKDGYTVEISSGLSFPTENINVEGDPEELNDILDGSELDAASWVNFGTGNWVIDGRTLTANTAESGAVVARLVSIEGYTGSDNVDKIRLGGTANLTIDGGSGEGVADEIHVTAGSWTLVDMTSSFTISDGTATHSISNIGRVSGTNDGVENFMMAGIIERLIINAGEGADILTITGGGANTIPSGYSGFTRVNFSDNDDVVTVANASIGTLNGGGGTGTDRLIIDTATPVAIDFTSNPDSAEATISLQGSSINVFEFEGFTGGSATNDAVTFTAGDWELSGTAASLSAEQGTKEYNFKDFEQFVGLNTDNQNFMMTAIISGLNLNAGEAGSDANILTITKGGTHVIPDTYRGFDTATFSDEADMVTVSAANSIRNYVGGDGAANIIDVLIVGDDSSATINLAAGTLVQDGETINFSGFENFTGGGKNDSFNIAGFSAYAITADGGAGDDTFSAFGNTQDGSWTITQISPTSFTINDGTNTHTLRDIEAISGSDTKNDNFIMANVITGLEINAHGGTADTLTITGDGAHTAPTDGYTGFEMVNFSGANSRITVTAGSSIANILGGNATGTDALILGNHTVTEVTLSNGSSTLQQAADELRVNFSEFESLTLSNVDDVITLSGFDEHNISIDGGAGDNDTFNTGGGSWTIASASGNFTITDDTVANNSITHTLQSIETVNGGAENDSFTIDKIITGLKIDALGEAAGGADTLIITGSGTFDVSNDFSGFSNFEIVTFSVNDDRVIVTADASIKTFDGGGGTDRLVVGDSTAAEIDLSSSSNTLEQGGNSITISSFENFTGGAGTDSIKLAAGSWTIADKTGSFDIIKGATTYNIKDIEQITGSDRVDTFVMSQVLDGLTINAGDGTGNDTLQITAGGTHKISNKYIGFEALELSDLANTLTLNSHISQFTTINVGTHMDNAVIMDSTVTGNTSIDLTNGAYDIGGGVTGKFTGTISSVTGSVGDDILTVGDTGATFDGGTAGTDEIIITSGSWTLASVVDGFTLTKGSVVHTITNVDEVNVADGTSNDVLELASGSYDLSDSKILGLEVNGFETLTLADGANALTLSSSSTQFEAINVGTGDNAVVVKSTEAGGAIIDLSTGDYNINNAQGKFTGTIISVTGSSGGDSFTAGATAVTFVGGAGIDTLTGGDGDDTLTGGMGRDTFFISQGTDRITDFSKDENDLLNFQGANSFGAGVLSSLTFSETGNNIEITFGTGNKTILENVGGGSSLISDIKSVTVNSGGMTVTTFAEKAQVYFGEGGGGEALISIPSTLTVPTITVANGVSGTSKTDVLQRGDFTGAIYINFDEDGWTPSGTITLGESQVAAGAVVNDFSSIEQYEAVKADGSVVDARDWIRLGDTTSQSFDFDGGGGTDDRVYVDAGVWVISGSAISFTIGTEGGATHTIRNAEQVVGDSGNNSFKMDSIISGLVIDGGGGTNTLAITATEDGSHDISSGFMNFATATFTANADVVTVVANGGIANIAGGGGTDELVVGNNTNATIDFAQSSLKQGNKTINFSEFENFTGGDGTGDTLKLGTGTYSLSGAVGDFTLTASGANHNFKNVEKIMGSTGNDTFAMAGVIVNLDIDAGAGTADTLSITDGGSHIISSSYVGFESAAFSDNADTVAVMADSSIGTFIGGGGSGIVDTLAIGGSTDATIDFAGGTLSQTINANAKTISFSGFENFTGGGGTDTLKLGTGTHALSGASGDFTLTVGTAEHNFKAIEKIMGSASDDTFAMAGVIAGLAIDAGAGTADTLSIMAGGTHNIPSSYSGFEVATLSGGNDTVTVTVNGEIKTFNGGGGTSDHLYIDGSTATTIDFISGDNVTLTQGANSITIKGFENYTGGSGADTLELALGTHTLSGAVGDFTLTIGGANYNFEAIEKIKGSSTNDTFAMASVIANLDIDAGGGAADILSITAGGSHTISSSYVGFETATFSDNADMVTVMADSSIGTFIGGGGAGIVDTLAIGGSTDATIDFAGGILSQTINANAKTISFSGFENFTGGGGSDTLKLGTGTYSLSGAVNDFTLTVGGANHNFKNVEKIMGSTGNDTFMMAGVIANLDIDAGTGTADTLSITAGGSHTISSSYVGFETATFTANNVDVTMTADHGIKNLTASGGSNRLIVGNAATEIDLENSKFKQSSNEVSISGFQNFTGGTSNDTVKIAAGDYTLSGAANDFNLAKGGSTYNFKSFETIMGSTGADNFTMASAINGLSIDAGGGSDTLTITGVASHFLPSGFSNFEAIDFAGGNDTVTAIASANNSFAHIIGGAGTDRLIVGSNTAAVIDLSSSINTLTQGGNSVNFSQFENFTGGSGSDTVNLGAGSWTISGSSTDFTATGTVTHNFKEIETITGSTGADTFIMDSVISGLAIDAGGGSDTLTINAGGSQVIPSNYSNFEVVNFAGNDVMVTALANSGIKVLSASGSGSNSLAFGNAATTIDLGAGTFRQGANTVTISGFENFTGGSGNDTLIIGDFASAVNFKGGGGNNTITVASGSYKLTDTSDESSTLSDGTFTLSHGGLAHTLEKIDRIEASVGTTDNLTFTVAGSYDLSTANRVSGLQVVRFNTLTLSDGSDTAIVAGATAFTRIDGGIGTDWLELGSGITAVNLRTETARYINFENLRGTSGENTLTGDDAVNVIEGGTGDDELFGEGGHDTLRGQGDNDTLDGGEGNDTLDGGAGDDKLTGGDGDDKLTGGDGDDTFTASVGSDTITDFDIGDDTIDLSVWELSNFADAFYSLSGGDLTISYRGNALTIENQPFGLTSVSNKSTVATVLQSSEAFITGTFTRGAIFYIDTTDSRGYFGSKEDRNFASFERATAGVTFDLSNGNLSSPNSVTHRLNGVNGVIGSKHNDNITLDSSKNSIYVVTGGSDRVSNLGNDDILDFRNFFGLGADELTYTANSGNTNITSSFEGFGTLTVIGNANFRVTNTANIKESLFDDYANPISHNITDPNTTGTDTHISDYLSLEGTTGIRVINLGPNNNIIDIDGPGGAAALVVNNGVYTSTASSIGALGNNNIQIESGKSVDDINWLDGGHKPAVLAGDSEDNIFFNIGNSSALQGGGGDDIYYVPYRDANFTITDFSPGDTIDFEERWNVTADNITYTDSGDNAVISYTGGAITILGGGRGRTTNEQIKSAFESSLTGLDTIASSGINRRYNPFAQEEVTVVNFSEISAPTFLNVSGERANTGVGRGIATDNYSGGGSFYAVVINDGIALGDSGTNPAIATVAESIETFIGGRSADTFIGNANNNYFDPNGGSGTRPFSGYHPAASFLGEGGADTLVINSSSNGQSYYWNDFNSEEGDKFDFRKLGFTDATQITGTTGYFNPHPIDDEGRPAGFFIRISNANNLELHGLPFANATDFNSKYSSIQDFFAETGIFLGDRTFTDPNLPDSQTEVNILRNTYIVDADSEYFEGREDRQTTLDFSNLRRGVRVNLDETNAYKADGTTTTVPGQVAVYQEQAYAVVDTNQPISAENIAIAWTFSDINHIIGTAEADLLIGDSDDNTITGGGGGDIIVGGGGQDTVSYANAAQGLQGLTDTFIGIETYTLTIHADNVTFTTAVNETLTIDGNGGADNLVGGAGNETFIYNASATFDGKGGTDILQAAGAVNLNVDSIKDIENIVQIGGAGLVQGDNKANIITLFSASNVAGGGGDDTIIDRTSNGSTRIFYNDISTLNLVATIRLVEDGLDVNGTLRDILTITDTRANGYGTDKLFGANIIEATDGNDTITLNDFTAIRYDLEGGTDIVKIGAGVGTNFTVLTSSGVDSLRIIEGGRTATINSFESVDTSAATEAVTFTLHTLDTTITTNTAKSNSLILSNTLGAQDFDLTNGGNITGFENIRGNSSANTFIGNNNANIIKGEGGHDTIHISQGSDTIDGGTGTDTLSFASGSWVAVDTTLTSDGSGNFTLTHNHLNTQGRWGVDTFKNIETITLHADNDSFTIDINSADYGKLVFDSGGATSRSSGLNENIVFKGSSNDTLLVNGTSIGKYNMGGGSSDALSFAESGFTFAATNVVTLNSIAGYNIAALTGGILTSQNTERLILSSAADVVTVSSVVGRSIYIDGGGGGDTINGSAGNETFVYYAGGTFSGGAGNDTIAFTGNIDLAALPSGASGIESVRQLGAGSIRGDNNVNTITAIGNFNNTIRAGKGNDIINGGEGTDTFRYDDLATNGNRLADLNNNTARLNLTATLTVSGNTLTVTDERATGYGTNTFTNVESFHIGSASLTDASGTTYNDHITVDGIAGGTTFNLNNGTDTVVVGLDVINYGSSTFNTNGSATLVSRTDGNISMQFAGVEVYSITGTAAAETIAAKGNVTYIDAGGGADKLTGGDGNDTLIGGNGADDVFGGGGNDNLWGTEDGAGSRTVNAVDGMTYENVQDYYRGGAGNDVVWAQGGNDLIFGEDDDDNLNGQAGSDIIFGGDGDDGIDGGDHNDMIDGGAGDDRIKGGTGKDTFIISSGTDTISDLSSAAGDYVDWAKAKIGGTAITEDRAGALTFAISTDDANDLRVYGFTVDNVASELILEGYGSTSRISGINASNADTVAGAYFGSRGGGDRLFTFSGEIETNLVKGNGSNNNLTGTDEGDDILGEGGNDTITLSKGEDFINGGTGTDTARDINDTRSSNYTFTFSGGTATLTDADAAYGPHNLVSVERYDFRGGNDTLTLNSGVDNVSFNLGAGNDTVYVNAVPLANNTGLTNVDLGSGNDTIVINGGASVSGGTNVFQASTTNSRISNSANNGHLRFKGAERIDFEGTSGNDNITGTSGGNTIKGNNGNDTLNGGAGGDLLIGGDGQDRFIVSAGDDRISDFYVGSRNGNTVSGNDRLDFSNAVVDDGTGSGRAAFLRGLDYRLSGNFDTLTISDFKIGGVESSVRVVSSELGLAILNNGTGSTYLKALGYFLSHISGRPLLIEGTRASPAQENDFSISTAFEISFNGGDDWNFLDLNDNDDNNQSVDFAHNDTLAFNDDSGNLNRDELWQAIQQGHLEISYDRGDINVELGDANLHFTSADGTNGEGFENQFGDDNIVDTQGELDSFIALLNVDVL